jgi:hypothetical protein
VIAANVASNRKCRCTFMSILPLMVYWGCAPRAGAGRRYYPKNRKRSGCRRDDREPQVGDGIWPLCREHDVCRNVGFNAWGSHMASRAPGALAPDTTLASGGML